MLLTHRDCELATVVEHSAHHAPNDHPVSVVRSEAGLQRRRATHPGKARLLRDAELRE